MNEMTKAESMRLSGGVHQSIIHDSARKHVRGEAVYVDDMAEPEGLLHCWVVLSEKAHARILSLDLEAARKAPGVAAILTAADIPGENDVGPAFRGEPLLAEDVVEYAGQAIAIVLADSLAKARAAAELVEVEYETLPAILSIEDAMEKKSFLMDPMIMKEGDADAALAEAPHVSEGEFRAGGQDHFYLETHIAYAEPMEDDEMRIVSSTQHPTEVQHIVSRLLGVPYAAITVEVRRMGGGFGGKESQASQIAGMAAIATRLTGRPVKMRLTRDVDMLMTGKRHDTYARYKVGYDDEGRILAIDVDLGLKAGNVLDLSAAVLTRALCHIDNAYYLPNVHVRGYCCKTHTVSNTAFRGFGGPQGMIAIEAIVAHVADELGLSIDDVRAVNYYADGRDLTPYGQKVEGNNMPRVLDELVEGAKFAERKAEIARFNDKSPVIKRGIALLPVKFGISFNLVSLNQAGALVNVYTDGSVSLNHGGTEMGQGLYLKVAQVVAESFQVDIENIRISSTRTDKVPNTSATAASSGSDLNGMAALAACETIKGRMAEVMANEFGGDPAEVAFVHGQVKLGNHAMSFKDLAQKCWAERVSLSSTGFYKTPELSFDQASCKGNPFYYFTYGACIAEAAIDTLTGESRILRADILQDVGSSLNPAIDIGQIEGGFVQGLGWLTMEELWWDGEGQLRTHAPSTYKIPTSRDVPDLHIRLLSNAPNQRPTIFRSKAIGEPPFMLAIACWHALREAVKAARKGKDGPTLLEAPATIENVLKAIHA